MTFKKRAALGIAAFGAAAVAAAVPAQPASAYEYCLAAAFEGQPEICFGGSQCNEMSRQLSKLGIEVYCLQRD